MNWKDAWRAWESAGTWTEKVTAAAAILSLIVGLRSYSLLVSATKERCSLNCALHPVMRNDRHTWHLEIALVNHGARSVKLEALGIQAGSKVLQPKWEQNLSRLPITLVPGERAFAHYYLDEFKSEPPVEKINGAFAKFESGKVMSRNNRAIRRWRKLVKNEST